MAYPLEALLRPAHELRSACASALGAGVVIGAPGLFLLSRPWDWLLAGALVSYAAGAVLPACKPCATVPT